MDEGVPRGRGGGVLQRRHATLRTLPVIGPGRYLIEKVGPELRLYIVASNDDERPFTRDTPGYGCRGSRWTTSSTLYLRVMPELPEDGDEPRMDSTNRHFLSTR